MCGIVGGISERNALSIVLHGLKELEYRGYDSVGVAILQHGSALLHNPLTSHDPVLQDRLKQESFVSNYHFVRKRTTLRVQELIKICNEANLNAQMALGHTRWATHGAVNEQNTHPHISNDTIAIVHNGIIENHHELRTKLIAQGYKFNSDTDSEVIAHLIHYHLTIHHNSNGQSIDTVGENSITQSLHQAVAQATKQLTGAYAIGVVSTLHPKEIVCATFGAPLVLGIGINELFFASDALALADVTAKVIFLEDGDIAILSAHNATYKYEIYNNHGKKCMRSIKLINHLDANIGGDSLLGNYRHYMLKEIHEQPQVITNTINYLTDKLNLLSDTNTLQSSQSTKLIQPCSEPISNVFDNKQALSLLSMVKNVQIVACGTSYHAAMVAKYYIEQIADIHCAIDIASEYRYRQAFIAPDTLFVTISQSGETADTLACLKDLLASDTIKQKNIVTLTICNVAHSALVRLSMLHLLTQAGVEIGVASTKAFTTQLVTLLHLAYLLAKLNNKLSIQQEQNYLNDLARLPKILLETLQCAKAQIADFSNTLKYKDHALFLGRNLLYPIALEGALKIKEISYIHAEGYASGELKHGPLALIDKDMPVIVLLSTNILAEKVKNNIAEVLAREGRVLLISDSRACSELKTLSTSNSNSGDLESTKQLKVLLLPDLTLVSPYLLPIIYTIPLQLLAYQTALLKGTDVDKPRNLAKSVTVE